MNRRQLLNASALAALSAVPAGMAASTALAAPTSATAFSTVRRRMLSVTDFGAVGDGATDDTTAIQNALNATFAGADSTVLQFPPGEYRITRTLRVVLNSANSRYCGIVAYGARLNSAIHNYANIIEFVASASCGQITLEGLDIAGTGSDGIGLRLETTGSGKLCNITIADSAIQGCGATGMQVLGAVSEMQVINSYFRGNKGNGVGIAGSAIRGIHFFGCILGDNGVHGAQLFNEASDVAFHGCYLLLNQQFGLLAEHGCALLANCGFENNHQRASSFARGGAGVRVAACATLIGCTAYSIFNQTHLIDAFVNDHLTLIGCVGGGSGAASAAKLAKLRGDGSSNVSAIGCQGGIDYLSGAEATEIGTDTFGASFGRGWNASNQVRLGNYRLWVDSAGRLRMKNGKPTADADGTLIAVQG